MKKVGLNDISEFYKQYNYKKYDRLIDIDCLHIWGQNVSFHSRAKLTTENMDI